MASSNRIEIGVEMMEPIEGMTWPETVRALEDWGFSTMFAPDHFDEGFGAITAMATAAAATTTLRVATAVFCADFRHPAVLARELASIDQLSGGRLEVGLGAGYQVNDYRTTGLSMDPPKVRVDRLIEYVKVLKGLFAEGLFSFDGEYFRIDELDGTPRPLTPGGPPLFLAGGGKRMLTFAAQVADIVGINPTLPSSQDRRPQDGLPDAIDEKVRWVREAAGGRFEDLRLHAWLRYAGVTNSAETEAAALGDVFQAEPADVLSSPIVLLGSVEEIVERLHERHERWGYSYYTIQQPVIQEFIPVLRRLAG